MNAPRLASALMLACLVGVQAGCGGDVTLPEGAGTPLRSQLPSDAGTPAAAPSETATPGRTVIVAPPATTFAATTPPATTEPEVAPTPVAAETDGSTHWG